MKIIRFKYCLQFNLLALTAFMLLACDNAANNDNAFAIEDYQGKWLILNYWAEWCAPCIEEIPELNHLQKQFADQLVVAGVNFDRLQGEALNKLVRAMSIEYLNIENDPADALRLARPAALPTTYIFNPQGQLAAKLVGPQTVESILEMTDITR